MENRTGYLTNAIIWFGVAISVSEIEAGIQIGSMSALNSIWIPMILGHIVGGVLLFFVGLIGANLRLNSMESITSTFGNYGSKFFAFLNVAQLLAWVAVLNAQGALALMGLNIPIPFYIVCIILAVLVSLWVYVGVQRSSKITSIVMAVLLILLVALSIKLFAGNINAVLPISSSSKLGFWNIFEISIAMPISWLPVISDYTKDATDPVKVTAISAIAYTIASLWMYFIGIWIVGIGTTSISQAILICGLGVPGVIIIVLSTVTSNFLAANSAGESSKAIFSRINPKIAGMIIGLLSALLAISGIMNQYINFLYLISSVFAPMAAVLLVSHYIVKSEGNARLWYWNIFSWLVGFLAYQFTVNLDSIVLGPTLIAIIVSAVLAYVPALIRKIK